MSSYLGQNFLIDISVQDNIITYLSQIKDKYHINHILEIGPGKGALTQHIIKHFDHITLVEKDQSLASHLKKFADQADIIYIDILDYNLDQIQKDVIIYGSLPYYITSPIIQKFFVQHDYSHGCFIVQKEFGEKIASHGKHKSYLRRLLNYRYQVEYIQTIPASAFNPVPKVQSCIISIHAKKALMSDDQFEVLRILIEALGKFKRKTLNKSFKLLGWESIVLWEHHYTLPSDLGSKRLEECDYDDIHRCVW